MNKITSFVLDNGLKVIFNYHPGFEDVSGGICYNVGALNSGSIIGKNEIVVESGAAHFLEHCIFEYKGESVLDKFSELGADCDAVTFYERTAYLFFKSKDYLASLELLLKFCDDFKASEKIVNRERGIIAEELKMYSDDPQNIMRDELMNNLYFQHGVKNDIGGTLESIKNIDTEMLQQMHEYYYHPSNAVLVISGDFDLKKVTRLIKKFPFKKRHIGKIDYMVVQEPDGIVKEWSEKIIDIPVSLVSVGIKMPPSNDFGYDKLIYSIALALLFSPCNTEYHRLLKKGVIPSAFSYDYEVVSGASWIYIYAETEQIEQFIDEVTSLLSSWSKYINQKVFTAVKKSFIGGFIFRENTPKRILNDLLFNYFENATADRMKKIIKKITFKDVRKALSSIDLSKKSVSVVRGK